ncbi:hypothetical protein JR316_0009904 [Psilocybe cubensis]|uniref:Uncharacterized protein n=2 Tax=Psilocybe cubensis TaxID=181762 RepID=A0ACB8GPM5_PSICU|nr:hypothetical protein JR316_0009904 [Psilocybe cubensis]KAH9477678.1 hypothetical protein JR316_0009904 [Psilocybe cubensis]
MQIQSNIENLAKLCLPLAVKAAIIASSTAPLRTSRILEIFELMTAYEDSIDQFGALTAEIRKYPCSSKKTFDDLYALFIPRLCATLVEKNLDICAPPFSDLIHDVVGMYLANILKSKGCAVHIISERFGCDNCTECYTVDVFYRDPNCSEIVMPKLDPVCREHVLQNLKLERAFCTVEIMRTTRPMSVKLVKTPEVVLAATWLERRKVAKNFLAAIGSEDVIAKIMGESYTMVKDAIGGKASFSQRPRCCQSTTTSRGGRGEKEGKGLEIIKRQ